MEITKETADELVLAIEAYKTVAQQLIRKLVVETNQPTIAEIIKGNYYNIKNAAVLNGKEYLSDNWCFDVHGEHCLFKNTNTGQTLEVSLVDTDSIGDLDPYFFYNFLETTQSFKHLTKYFKHSFHDTLDFFEKLEQQKILTCLGGVKFRKVEVTNK